MPPAPLEDKPSCPRTGRRCLPPSRTTSAVGWRSAVEPSSEPAPPAFAPAFEPRLERLQAHLDQAERNAEQALAPLTTEIEALRQWLEALRTARGKLVERTARAV